LHATLARLTTEGVLVALCSKNDEADVWQVFDTRGDLGLRREHVVAAAINWLPKSQNLRELAGSLNLGLDSFVFIDDNPVECAEVRANCPEVLTIQWPEQPDEAERLLDHVWEFDAVKTTGEDARRTEMYREEFRRREARAGTLTFKEFIDGLALDVDIAPLAADDLRRASQLTLRTNQFNFTTIRRDEAELLALLDRGRHEIRTVRVRDRFGDYGLVGLVIVERIGEMWNLDTFLLSCRVLGRGVEHRVIAEVGSIAAAGGARSVALHVEPTARNHPARAFLEAIAAASLGRGPGERGVCEMAVEKLADVRFEPGSSLEVIAEEEPTAMAAAPIDFDRLRRREAEIARAALHPASAVRPHREREDRRDAPIASETNVNVAGIVYGAFAGALRLPIATVQEVDQLETLGCDSLRIVEITVTLSESFPWLPRTLLFEHRSVSQIVDEIARRIRPAAIAASPVAATTATRRGEHNAVDSDIAVVGMHVRCAGVDSPDELWDLLAAKRSEVRPVPCDRPHFLQPLQDARPHWAGLLNDVAGFDAEFFGVSPREAEFMDPQLRLFLEVAWAA
jgi:FkbH-like protein